MIAQMQRVKLKVKKVLKSKQQPCYCRANHSMLMEVTEYYGIFYNFKSIRHIYP